MTTFFIRPTTPRPDFRLVITFLWRELENVDTDGDSDNPASREWTELCCANRERPLEVFDIAPVADEPLMLRVESKLSQLAARVAYFLAVETESLVAASVAGPWHAPSWLADEVGSFDLAEGMKRAASSRWRRATLDDPFPPAF